MSARDESPTAEKGALRPARTDGMPEPSERATAHEWIEVQESVVLLREASLTFNYPILRHAYSIGGRSAPESKSETPSPTDVESTSTCWMSHYATALKNVPLCQVALPGTHDSGTYSLTPESSYTVELRRSPMLKLAALVGFGRLAKQIVLRWATCQSQTISAQLESGVRYFDIRVIVVNDEYRICHGLCGDSLSVIFEAFATFARRHPTEIIILDLVPHHLYEFDSQSTHGISHHLRFAKLIQTTFRGMLCSSRQLNGRSPLRKFWRAKTNVVIIYNPPRELPREEAALFWPSHCLESYWPRHCKNPPDWREWASSHAQSRPSISELFVLQGVITPDRKIIAGLSHHARSLRQISQQLNPQVVNFLLENTQLAHNITILDFYDQSDLSLACEWINAGGSYLFTEREALTHGRALAMTIFSDGLSKLTAIGVHSDGTTLIGQLSGSRAGAIWERGQVAYLPLNERLHLAGLSVDGQPCLLAHSSLGLQIYRWQDVQLLWTLNLNLPQHLPLGDIPSCRCEPSLNYALAATTQGIALVQLSIQQHDADFDQIQGEPPRVNYALDRNDATLVSCLPWPRVGAPSDPAQSSFLSFVFRCTLHLLVFSRCSADANDAHCNCSTSAFAFDKPANDWVDVHSPPLSGICLRRTDQWVVCAGRDVVLVACRHADDLLTLKFDGHDWTTPRDLNLPSGNLSSATLKLFALQGDVHLLVRATSDLVAFRYARNPPRWLLVSRMHMHIDHDRWVHADSPSALHVTVLRERVALVTVRHKWGILTVKLSRGRWVYLGRRTNQKQKEMNDYVRERGHCTLPITAR